MALPAPKNLLAKTRFSPFAEQADAMRRTTVWLAFGLLLLISVTGCPSIDLGPWGGAAYTLDTGKIGSGQQAIIPRNDNQYWDGQPMDSHTGR